MSGNTPSCLTGTWLAGKFAFGRLLFSGAVMKMLPAKMPQATMTPDGPLEMNRVGCSLELPSDCSFDLTLSLFLVISFSCVLTDFYTH